MPRGVLSSSVSSLSCLAFREFSVLTAFLVRFEVPDILAGRVLRVRALVVAVDLAPRVADGVVLPAVLVVPMGGVLVLLFLWWLYLVMSCACAMLLPAVKLSPPLALLTTNFVILCLVIVMVLLASW